MKPSLKHSVYIVEISVLFIKKPYALTTLGYHTAIYLQTNTSVDAALVSVLNK